MPDYQIRFARSARKELESLPNSHIVRILRKIESLSIDPRPPGCKKLIGIRDLRRIRVGDFRVIYSVNRSEIVIEIIAIRHRGDAYR